MLDPKDVYGRTQWGYDAQRDESERVGVRRTTIAPRQCVSGVYFLGAGGADLVKIGTVIDAEKVTFRINTLQAGCPYPLVLLFMIMPAGRHEESRMHRWFKTEHFRGEWYRYRGALAGFLDYALRDPAAAKEDALARCKGC